MDTEFGVFILRSLEVQSGHANRKNGAASQTSPHRRLSRVSSCPDAQDLGLLSVKLIAEKKGDGAASPLICSRQERKSLIPKQGEK